MIDRIELYTTLVSTSFVNTSSWILKKTVVLISGPEISVRSSAGDEAIVDFDRTNFFTTAMTKLLTHSYQGFNSKRVDSKTRDLAEILLIQDSRQFLPYAVYHLKTQP